MPNGGGDNCAVCWFNTHNHGEAGIIQHNLEEPAYCEIRHVLIPNPGITYCINHPQWCSQRDSVPIGPIFIDPDGGGRTLWKPAPDTDAIRQHLVTLASTIQEYTVLSNYIHHRHFYQFVVWQLGEFQEPRAQHALQRIVKVTTSLTHIKKNTTRRTLTSLHELAQEALRKIAARTAERQWKQQYAANELRCVEQVMRLFSGIGVSSEILGIFDLCWNTQCVFPFFPDEKPFELISSRKENLVILEEEFHLQNVEAFLTQHPDCTFADLIGYIIAHVHSNLPEEQGHGTSRKLLWSQGVCKEKENQRHHETSVNDILPDHLRGLLTEYEERQLQKHLRQNSELKGYEVVLNLSLTDSIPLVIRVTEALNAVGEVIAKIANSNILTEYELQVRIIVVSSASQQEVEHVLIALTNLQSQVFSLQQLFPVQHETVGE